MDIFWNVLLYEAVEITKKIMIKKGINSNYLNYSTAEPRFNEALFNKVLDIMNQSYSKTYGIEPRYNEPSYNEPRYNEPRYNEHNLEAQM